MGTAKGTELGRVRAVLVSSGIDDAVQKAMTCLERSCRDGNPGMAGWYHYLDDSRPGVTASAVGLLLHRMTGSRFDREPEVIAYLLSEQAQDPDGRPGGWPVRTTDGFPILEATAWVVRALSLTGTGRPDVAEALRNGARWLVDNQNPDGGWGSYKGQPSRTFHTALAVLALTESGIAAPATFPTAAEWLRKRAVAGHPAWGPQDGASPTILHTAIALLALGRIGGSTDAALRERAAAWLLERLEAGVYTEPDSEVEEFDLPYIPQSGPLRTFQNSLPHFAGPVAVSALLSSGIDALDPKLFQMTSRIIADQQDEGHWLLPRSRRRQSIWAVWPFVAALTAMRTELFGSRKGLVTLLSPGTAVFSADPLGPPSLPSLLWQAMWRGIGFRPRSVLLASISAIVALTSTILIVLHLISWNEFLLAIIYPVLMTAFQIAWSLTRK